MSIQQNINQLIGLTGTAMMLSPQLRQKVEDTTKLRKLAKEESSLKTLQEASHKEMKSEQYIKTTHRINELRGIKDPSELDKAELLALQNERTDFLAARDERFNRLVEIAKERSLIDPTPENIEAARTMQTTKSWKKTIQQRGKQKRDGLNEAVQEGQTRVQNKQQTEEFQQKIGVREQIGFKPLSEHRDFRRRLKDDSE